MPTTERWIEWSKDFARPYKRTNYQLYLEVAQAACRYSRDSRGMSTIPELANADHYWLSRYFVFLGAGAGRDTIQPTDAATLNQRQNISAVQDVISFFTGAVTAYALVPVLTVGWDVWKRVDPRDPPMGEPPASAPSATQIMWAFRGCNVGFVKDANHANQMIWGWAMNRYLNTTLTIPAPPV